MESLQHKLRQSRTALDRQRVVLLGKRHRAGADFVDTTSSATMAFGRFAAQESSGWWEYLQGQASKAPALWNPANIVEIEREVWLQLARLLDALQGKVHSRIRQLAEAPQEQKVVELPLKDYESLTAREILTQVRQLSPSQCRVVHAFEGSHKKRATVLRALQQRMAA